MKPLDFEVHGDVAQRLLYHTAHRKVSDGKNVFDEMSAVLISQLNVLGQLAQERYDGYRHGFVTPKQKFEEITFPCFDPIRLNYANHVKVTMSNGEELLGNEISYKHSWFFKNDEDLELTKIAFDCEDETFLPLYAFQLSEVIWYNTVRRKKSFAKLKESKVTFFDISDVMNSP